MKPSIVCAALITAGCLSAAACGGHGGAGDATCFNPFLAPPQNDSCCFERWSGPQIGFRDGYVGWWGYEDGAGDVYNSCAGYPIGLVCLWGDYLTWPRVHNPPLVAALPVFSSGCVEGSPSMPQSAAGSFLIKNFHRPLPEYRFRVKGIELLTVEMKLFGEVRHVTMAAIPQPEGGSRIAILHVRARPMKVKVER